MNEFPNIALHIGIIASGLFMPHCFIVPEPVMLWMVEHALPMAHKIRYIPHLLAPTSGFV